MLPTTAALWLLSHKRILYRLLSRRLRLALRSLLRWRCATLLALRTAPWLALRISPLLSLLWGNLLR